MAVVLIRTKVSWCVDTDTGDRVIDAVALTVIRINCRRATAMVKAKTSPTKVGRVTQEAPPGRVSCLGLGGVS